ncbi:hypothetical protein F4774DRAFT_372747 [Daldinia eschscholtzii]|nr:hypothetical protein F4774DRAFT_372747 [Daldinia eschscholtzii]
MRKLDLVTPLVLVLGAVFNGVFATRLPFVQQDDFLQAPGVGSGYRHKASSAGLAQIPGAQVTAGQLVALPGLEETGAGGETATSVVSSVAVETTSSIAIVTGSTTSAETKTSETIMLSSSVATMPVGSIQSFQIVSSVATSFGVIANSSTLAISSSSHSVQYFHTISASAAVTTATSPMFANVSTSAFVVSTPRAAITSTFGGFYNSTATHESMATVTSVSHGSESAGLVALPTSGSAATGNTETLLPDTLGSLSGSSSSTSAVEVRPSEAAGGLREIPGVQTTPGLLVPVSSGVANPTAVATASGVSSNSTLPSFSSSAATMLTADKITAVLAMGVTGVLTVFFL